MESELEEIEEIPPYYGEANNIGYPLQVGNLLQAGIPPQPTCNLPVVYLQQTAYPQMAYTHMAQPAPVY